jgi:hypothetical protein
MINQDPTNTNSINYLIPCPSGNYVLNNVSTNLSNLQRDINNIFNTISDLSGTKIYFKYNSDNSTVDCSLVVNINQTFNLFNGLSTWNKYLHISESMIAEPFDISNSLIKNSTYTVIQADSSMNSNYINIDNTNNTLIITPFEDGVYDTKGFNTIRLTIPTNPLYTRDNLLTAINTIFSRYTDSYGNNILSNSSIFVIRNTKTGIEQTVIRLIINKIYTAYNYNIVFYDPYSFVKCYVGASSVKNTSWDTTMGWILGFRDQTEYILKLLSKENICKHKTKFFIIIYLN